MKIKDKVIDFLYDEYHRLKTSNLKVSMLEQTFINKFRSWDKSDCSIVGALKILLWYTASIENEDEYRDNEYSDLIEYLDE